MQAPINQEMFPHGPTVTANEAILNLVCLFLPLLFFFTYHPGQYVKLTFSVTQSEQISS